MSKEQSIELFILKCAAVESGVRNASGELQTIMPAFGSTFIDKSLEPYIKQFSLQNRRNATNMATYYQLFYMLENDIRRLIADTLENAHGSDWWDTHVSKPVKDEVSKNREREAKAALTIRSEDEIDYTTFGQLSDIIRENWADFAGMLSNESAVARVLSALNMLRGTIAHCGVLADDEVDRLRLAIKDWFRVLEGPKS